MMQINLLPKYTKNLQKPACTKCGVLRTNVDFRGALCVPCDRQRRKEYREANPEKVRQIAKRSHARRYIERVYDISPAEFEALRCSQNNACAICCEPFSESVRLNVDHCHKTGQVRGLLCWPCNTGIGKLKDSAELLARAAAYLSKDRS